jgi:hypothetical protein
MACCRIVVCVKHKHNRTFQHPDASAQPTGHVTNSQQMLRKLLVCSMPAGYELTLSRAQNLSALLSLEPFGAGCFCQAVLVRIAKQAGRMPSPTSPLVTIATLGFTAHTLSSCLHSSGIRHASFCHHMACVQQSISARQPAHYRLHSLPLA